MINLLFVDDEEYTREGILNNLTQNHLDIDNIKVAENGSEALEIAKDFPPDILLSDIKMPIMDGIELGFKIRKLYPYCKIIFMSGYTDREYLKSAIDLQVYQYIEKPVILDELNNLLLEVANLCKSEQDQLLNQKEVAVALQNTYPLMKRELALSLTKKSLRVVDIQNKLEILKLGYLHNSPMITLLIKIPYNDISEQYIYEIEEYVARCLTTFNLHALCVFKNDNLYIVHLYDLDGKGTKLNEEHISKFCSNVISMFKHSTNLIIAVGQKANGIDNVYNSYKTAVLALEKSFFTGYGTTIFQSFDNNLTYNFNEQIKEDFKNALVNKQKDKAISIVKQLSHNIKRYPGTLVNKVKNFYYQLDLIILALKNPYEEIDADQKEFLMLQSIYSFSTIDDLKNFTIEIIEDFFKNINSGDIHDTVWKVEKYIKDNYSNQNLSIKDISEHVFLNTSYLCVLYKSKTEKTINQFITEHRMQIAKILLRERNKNVKSIALECGYSDYNYFSKIFKKHVGVSPFEYRKKHIL